MMSLIQKNTEFSATRYITWPLQKNSGGVSRKMQFFAFSQNSISYEWNFPSPLLSPPLYSQTMSKLLMAQNRLFSRLQGKQEIVKILVQSVLDYIQIDYFGCGFSVIAGMLHCLSPKLMPSHLCSVVFYSFSWPYELRLMSNQRTM